METATHTNRLICQAQKATGKNNPHTLDRKADLESASLCQNKNIAPNVPAKYNNPLNSIIAYNPT